VASCGVFADTDGDGAGNMTERRIDLGNSCESLPDSLIPRNTPATRTRHELWGRVPTAVDKAADVLEETNGAITLHERASHGLYDPTVSRSGGLPGGNHTLPSLWERQDDKRRSHVHWVGPDSGVIDSITVGISRPRPPRLT
jgi:hypothetical protein